MSLQYSNTITARKFIAAHPELRITKKDKGRFSFYYTSPSDTTALPVITTEEPHRIQYFQWGLIPSWVKSPEEAAIYRTKTLNAKSETIFKLPTYRGYIKRKRCLIPATGFIEWHLKLGLKYPFLVRIKEAPESSDTRSFCFGGIYSTWVDQESGEVFNTFSMITTPGNETLSFIHNRNKRMPLILSQADEVKWLDPLLTNEDISALMKPYADNLILAQTISRKFVYKGADPNVPETLVPMEYKNLEMQIG